MKQITVYFTFTLILLLTWFKVSGSLPIKAENGIIDLKEWDAKKNLALDGEWEFFWNEMWMPGKKSTAQAKHFIVLPGVWNDYDFEGSPLKGNGFATYRLQVVNAPANMQLALKVPAIGTTCAIYLDSLKIYQAGIPGKDKNSTTPKYDTQIVPIHQKGTDFNITIILSNFHHRKGGFWRQLFLGTENMIRKTTKRYQFMDLFLLGSFIIMALYHIGLFLLRKKDRSPLYFSLFCIFLALRISVTGEYFLNFLMEISWELMIKIEYLSFYVSLVVFALFIESLFPNEFKKKILRIILIIASLFILLVLFTPASIFTHTILPFQAVIVVTGIYAIYSMVLALKRKRNGAAVMLVGFLIFFLATINDILYHNEILNTANLFSWGLFIFIFGQAFLLSSRFSTLFLRNENLSTELNYTNRNLEKLVDEKTASLTNVNNELSKKNLRISSQNKKIKDSIQYASRIQKAILPPIDIVSPIIPDHFIFFEPKDIVSGDFYWISRQENKLIIACADCTGHGVPGAFMSMLGVAFLNEVVNSKKHLQPNEILNHLREMVINSLRQEGKRFENKDGMDIALCMIDLETKRLHYAGAYNPLYIIRRDIDVETNEEKSELYQFDADKMPIGIFVRQNEPFTNHTIELKQEDNIYLFTDGYTDQLGGKNKRKFLPKRLRELLIEIHEFPMEKQKEILEKNLLEWRGEIDQVDDILIMGFKVPDLSGYKGKEPTYRWNRKTILIAEDSEFNFLALQADLDATNAKIIWAKNGKTAIGKCIEKSDINIVLMDLLMPVIDGYKAIEETKKIRPELPIVVQTAFSQSDEKEKSFKAGCDDYITKPILQKELLATLSKYLDR